MRPYTSVFSSGGLKTPAYIWLGRTAVRPYASIFSSGAKERSSFLMPASPWKATTTW